MPRTEPLTPTTTAIDESPREVVQPIEANHAQAIQDALPSGGTPIRRQHRAASAPPLNAGAEPAPGQNPGFLGVTSYSSIFADLNHLGVAPSELEDSQVRHFVVSRDRMVQSCETLAFLKDRKSTLNRLVARAFDVARGFSNIVPEPIIKHWLLKLWPHHGDTLEHQEPERIYRLSEQIWRNTCSPITFDGNTVAMEWANLGTGPNIRWEVIGLIAAVAGICALSLRHSDSLLVETGITGVDFARRMRSVAETCLSFSRSCEAINDMFLWLVCETGYLIVALEGEDSYASYQASGEEVNAVIAMGLHQKIEANDELPIFLAETRKLVFVLVYTSEIGFAAFLGRPPRLSYRYSSLELPLDITEAQLMLGKDEIATIVRNTIDKDGFNTSKRLGRIARLRVQIPFSCRREEILDLALGQHATEEILRRAKVIQDKTEEQWSRFPEWIRRIRSDPIEFGTLKPIERLHRFYICQSLRGNELLLQRVLIRKAGAGSEKLIQEARRMFKDVLHVSQRVDLETILATDITAVLVILGLRSAAIVAVELVKQEQLPFPDSALLPRSQTIQELSVFAARLGSVDPEDGSFSICDQGRKVITRILDKILSPSTTSERGCADHRSHLGDSNQERNEHHHTATVSGGAVHRRGLTPDVQAPAGTAGDTYFGFDGSFLEHDKDFMQWLENVDWDRPEPWITF